MPEKATELFEVIAIDSKGKIVHQSTVTAERLIRVKRIYIEEGFKVTTKKVEDSKN
jgi:hypothetical protein